LDRYYAQLFDQGSIEEAKEIIFYIFYILHMLECKQINNQVFLELFRFLSYSMFVV
jgi:hypothetical protein